MSTPTTTQVVTKTSDWVWEAVEELATPWKNTFRCWDLSMFQRHVCELFPLGACDFGWHYISHKLLLLSGYRLGSSVKNSFSKGICRSVVSSWIWGGAAMNCLLVLNIRNCMGEGNLRQPRGFWEFLLSQSLWPTEESSSSCSTRGWLEFIREARLGQMTW